MEPIKVFNVKMPVILLKLLDNGFMAVIDSQTTLRMINMVTYSVVGGFKTNIEQERTCGHIADVATNGSVSAVIVPDTNKAAVFSIPKKSMLYKVGRHQGGIESVAVDPLHRYVVTGGEDGKVFAWALKTSKLAFSLPPHSDFVTTIGFSANGLWMATGSFDKSITAMNIATMKASPKLRGHTAPIVDLCFLSKTHLVSADKEGGLIVWNYVEGKVVSRMTKMHDDISALCISDDSHFLFVASKLGYVALYDMQTYEQISQRYIKESTQIASLIFLKEGLRLVLGLSDGNVKIYSLMGDQKALVEMVREGQYVEFFKLIEDNPVLKYSEAYDLFEKIWNDRFEKVKVLLERGEKAGAEMLFEPFKAVPGKNLMIQNILKDYEKYATFRQYVTDKRYALAYPMAHQYPFFKETKPYILMETQWKKLFYKAQELILKKDGQEAARQLLSAYRGISEKTALTQQLFSQSQLYLYFKELISKKEFVKFFGLVKNHPFLAEFSEYTAVMNYGDSLYMKMHDFYQHGQYVQAQKICMLLSAFPDYAEDVKEMTDSIRAKQQFEEAVAAKNYANVFALLNTYPLLADTPKGKLLEEQWNEAADEAGKYAAKGDVEAIKKAIKPYLEVETKFQAIANLYQQCYTAQIEEAFRSSMSQKVIQMGMINYLRMFGIDDFVENLKGYYEKVFKHTFDLEAHILGNIETWKPSKIVPDILKATQG